MPDPADRRFMDGPPAASAGPDADAARVRFAAARVRALEHIEQRMLELAVRASDDTEARWLELWADAAWRDARALRLEHMEESSPARG
jgi:hypothetical protein